MRILIIDDSPLWIEQGKTILEKAGHKVTGCHVANPKEMIAAHLPQTIIDAMCEAEVVLIDKDFGGGISSTTTVCMIRYYYPSSPIIRWTDGCETTKFMYYLGVSVIKKPTRKFESEFTRIFTEALTEQRIILSGPRGVLDILNKTRDYNTGSDLDSEPPSIPDEKEHQTQLDAIQKIAQLAESDCVKPDFQGSTFAIPGMRMYRLCQCICDGVLTAEDIRPHLPGLKKFITKLETAGEIDERYRFCAEFIKAGKLDLLELVRDCY